MRVLSFLAVFCIMTDLQAQVVACPNDMQNINVGVRPRGMVGRSRPHKPVLTFSDLDESEWVVSGENGGKGRIFRSREYLCWEEASAALCYSGTGKDSAVIYRPRMPVDLPESFDSLEIWTAGRVSGWEAEQPESPRVVPFIEITDGNNNIHKINLKPIVFPWWYAIYKSIDSKSFAVPLKLTGFGLAGCTNNNEKALFIDSFVFFTMDRQQKIKLSDSLFDIQIDPDTILPPSGKAGFKNSIYKKDDFIIFAYTGADETLTWKINPKACSFDSIAVEFPLEGKIIRPSVRGGPVLPGKVELVSCLVEDSRAILQYEIISDGEKCNFTWDCCISGKSLVIKLSAVPNLVKRISLGRLEGENARAQFVPYLTVGNIESDKKIGIAGDKFVSVLPCWYSSNASVLFESDPNRAFEETSLGGDVVYKPVNGRLSDLNEKIIFTASSKFDEVLPTIANKVSEYRELLSKLPALHQAYTETLHWKRDVDRFKYLKRKGVEKLLVRHHSYLWADNDSGPQEWTLTENAAPNVGNGAIKKYLAELKKLDYFPILYTNYTDLQPVSPRFDYGIIIRNQDQSIRTECWPGSYPIKPLAAIELENYYAPKIHERFGVQGSFLDVHTAVNPWDRTDFDWCVPKVGMFRTTYYAYLNILKNEKKNYNGPVMGEGAMRLYYAGFSDGDDTELAQCWKEPYNYPWLVDFDLNRLHQLQIGYGMSFPHRFLPAGELKGINNPHSEGINHFLAATIAYGHAGLLPLDAPEKLPYHSAVRAYHLICELQQRYLLARPVSIRYFDGSRLVTTEQALIAGSIGRNQLFITYDNGLEIAVNGSTSLPWSVTVQGSDYKLPPYGWVARGPGILEYSSLMDGHRADYVNSPAYIFFDGWGTETDFGPVVSDGAGKMVAGKDLLRVLVYGPYKNIEIRPELLGHSKIPAKVSCEHEDGTVSNINMAEKGPCVLPEIRGAFAFTLYFQ